MKIVPIYDRSDLIRRSISKLMYTILEVIATVVFVILLFLWHVPSAVIPVITIPVAVPISFVPFHALGINANIMSLGGIAIAIGALVDATIVVIEQTHKKLEEWQSGGRVGDERQAIVAAVKVALRAEAGRESPGADAPGSRGCGRMSARAARTNA